MNMCPGRKMTSMNCTSLSRGESACLISDTNLPSQSGGRNFVALSIKIEAVKVEEKVEAPAEAEEKIEATAAADDNDDWGAVPAFLRRKK